MFASVLRRDAVEPLAGRRAAPQLLTKIESSHTSKSKIRICRQIDRFFCDNVIQILRLTNFDRQQS